MCVQGKHPDFKVLFNNNTSVRMDSSRAATQQLVTEFLQLYTCLMRVGVYIRVAREVPEDWSFVFRGRDGPEEGDEGLLVPLEYRATAEAEDPPVIVIDDTDDESSPEDDPVHVEPSESPSLYSSDSDEVYDFMAEDTIMEDENLVYRPTSATYSPLSPSPPPTQPVPVPQPSHGVRNLCGICQDPDGFTNAIMTGCRHMFCGTCLYAWLTTPGRSGCPVCRQVSGAVFGRMDSA
ncbi:hypothetical protein Bhyg_07573 [Pseudolycoriella hygida]|uniref:RING-type domain-containing protein n=1 Tax=Pseudolycoriella hygida TaxID=35572 RepID=A0A9Q0N314_9DIPT|nr:hypothetical protein Bhyg_07573 [Pseudolycoriella hygida]